MNNICIECGKNFETTFKPSQFCSPKCRTYNYRKAKDSPTAFKPHCPTCQCGGPHEMNKRISLDRNFVYEPVKPMASIPEEDQNQDAPPIPKPIMINNPSDVVAALASLAQNHPKYADQVAEEISKIEEAKDDVEVVSERDYWQQGTEQPQ